MEEMQLSKMREIDELIQKNNAKVSQNMRNSYHNEDNKKEN
jgi:hypothetical protein